MDDFENDFGHDELERDWDEPYEPDSWADGDALASAGWGTDEDYGGEDRYLDSYYENQYDLGDY